MKHLVLALVLSAELVPLVACGGPEADDTGPEQETAEAAADTYDPNGDGGGRVGPVTAATLVRITSAAHDRVAVSFRCGRNTDGHSLHATPQDGGAPRYTGTVSCVAGQTKTLYDTGVEPGRAYCWRVVGANTENEARTASVCTSIPLDYNAVAAPDLTISGVDQTSAGFVIDDRSNNEGGFRLQMFDNGAWTTIHTVMRSTRRHAQTGPLARMTDHRFTPGSSRSFRVEAFKEYAPASAFSPIYSVRFPDWPPTAPTNLRVIGVEERAVTLAWDDAQGEDGYQIYADITADTDEQQTVGAGTTQHRFYSIASGYAVCFIVTAYNSGGSAPSNEVCTRTHTAPPGDRTADVRLVGDPPIMGLKPFVGLFPGFGVATGDVSSVELPSAANSNTLLSVTFISPSADTTACGDPMRSVTVPRGGRLDGPALMRLYGDSSPPLPIAFKTCVAVSSEVFAAPLLRIQWFGY